LETNLSGAFFCIGSVVLLLFLFVFLDFFLIKSTKKIRAIILAGILFCLFLLPVFAFSKSNDLLTRFRQENLFSKYSYPDSIFPTYHYLGHLVGHMFSYFSPANYGTVTYHWIKNSVSFTPDFVILGWLEPFFILLGLFYVLKRLRKFEYRYLIYWIMATLAPASVTWNWMHILRALNGLVVIEMFVLFGIIQIFDIIKYNFFRKCFLIILVMYGVFMSIFVIVDEYSCSNYENNGEYQPGGFEEGWKEVLKVHDNYENIIVDVRQARGYIFMAFYTQYDPNLFAKWAKLNKGLTDEDKPYTFGKYEFRKIDWDSDKKLKSTLLWIPKEIFSWELNDTKTNFIYNVVGPNKGYKSGSIIGLP